MFGKRSDKYNEKQIKKAVSNLKEGSAEAFHILYTKYHNKIYRYCLRMLGDEAQAKDAFQETFIRVYENRDKFQGKNFSAWLFTIARHTCLNVLRAKRPHDTFDETFHAKEENKPVDVGLKKQIEQAVTMLPEDLREAFVLREYNEYSYKEIAEILDIELSLAKVRVYRARVILRKLLKPIRKEIHES